MARARSQFIPYLIYLQVKGCRKKLRVCRYTYCLCQQAQLGIKLTLSVLPAAITGLARGKKVTKWLRNYPNSFIVKSVMESNLQLWLINCRICLILNPIIGEQKNPIRIQLKIIRKLNFSVPLRSQWFLYWNDVAIAIIPQMKMGFSKVNFHWFCVLFTAIELILIKPLCTIKYSTIILI